MSSQELSEDLLAVLRIVKEKGGTDCTGSCHHRKPGEFHCHAMAQMLNLSSSGMKQRILDLIRMGLMERHIMEREGSTPLTRFQISSRGDEILANYDRRS